MGKIDKVYEGLLQLQKENSDGVTTYELSNYLELDRANISRYLNILYKENKVIKKDGRPVKYLIEVEELEIKEKEIELSKKTLLNNDLENLIGSNGSLQIPVQQAKAAMLYPPRGIHTLILGETGVGKSMFAEAMYKFSKSSGILKEEAKFIRFNCADYADNPQLVMAQIFGVKKGAYTGADSDKEGLLKQADGGILFLDEIHRLSPQGQEMLFTFIDKGVFRPLGHTESPIKAEVQIISATTEDPKSYLLKTFTRRIPMAITLPSLKDRSISERYYLLEEFIKEESRRLGESIYFNKNALISFLLYECPNNIGQLKSDIQLACAKSFLNYKSNKTNFIIVDQSDLSNRVSKGIMNFQKCRKDIDKLLNNMGDTLIFSGDTRNGMLIKREEEKSLKEDIRFYDIIESKFIELKDKGMSEKEISKIINIDIDRYFSKYINNLKNDYRSEEIRKIVSDEIIVCVDRILEIASKKLNRSYDEKVYYGLALHLVGSIERIRKGRKIYNPRLNNIRVEYTEEFIIAMEITEEIEGRFGIHIPLDEIGYLTMFLSSKTLLDINMEEEKVSVLVIMHGYSTASSMVDVANNLIGEDYIEALDMPLDMKAEEMFNIARNKILNIDKGKGVLLLVDMGSLTNFGSIIMEETGVTIKTVDIVSTITVIEAGRNALNGRSINEIYSSCIDVTRGKKDNSKLMQNKKENIIITTCFTGEGSALKLKEIILRKLEDKNIQIKALDILDRDEFIRKLEKVKNEFNVIAIVGTVNMKILDIPFISATDILAGDGIDSLLNYIIIEDEFIRISESMNSQIQNANGKLLVKLVRRVVIDVQEKLQIKISQEVALGVVIHICFMIEKILNGEKGKKFENLNSFRNLNNKEFILVKQSLRNLEINYNISIRDDDLAYLVSLFINNKISV